MEKITKLYTETQTKSSFSDSFVEKQVVAPHQYNRKILVVLYISTLIGKM